MIATQRQRYRENITTRRDVTVA